MDFRSMRPDLANCLSSSSLRNMKAIKLSSNVNTSSGSVRGSLVMNVGNIPKCLILVRMLTMFWRST